MNGPATRARARTAATYAAISLASLFAGFAGFVIYDGWKNPIPWEGLPYHVSGASWYMPDRELGFVARPNLDLPGRDAARSHFTNARSARIARPNTAIPERVDFISVGDSQTFGQGVASDQTFTGVLSTAANLSGLNLGMSGHGGPLLMKDIAASAFRNWRALTGYLASGGKVRPISQQQKTEATVHVLKEMKASADSIGARLLVVHIPDYSAPVIKGLAPEVAEPAGAAGIAVLDMAARLREMRQAGVALAIANDGHMTAAVHRAIAEEVMKHLPR